MHVIECLMLYLHDWFARMRVGSAYTMTTSVSITLINLTARLHVNQNYCTETRVSVV